MFPEQRGAAVALASSLRAAGESVDLALRPQKPKKFFSHADSSHAAKAVFVGPDDVERGVAKVKDLLMRACGYTYRECEGEGWMLPVVHAELDYRSPARYDDLLEVTAYVQSAKGVRLEIACEVRRKGEDAVLVRGFTRHCFVSTKTFRPIPPPERFAAILAD